MIVVELLLRERGHKTTPKLGSPLAPGQTLDFHQNVKPSDKKITGYSIIQGSNIEEIRQALEDHPHLRPEGCTIEISDAMPIPGMETQNNKQERGN
jgi:hypothetical protein